MTSAIVKCFYGLFSRHEKLSIRATVQQMSLGNTNSENAFYLISFDCGGVWREGRAATHRFQRTCCDRCSGLCVAAERHPERGRSDEQRNIPEIKLLSVHVCVCMCACLCVRACVYVHNRQHERTRMEIRKEVAHPS